MYEIIQSATFSKWLSGLKDQQARMRVHVRLDRVMLGNFGDAVPIEKGFPNYVFTMAPVIGCIIVEPSPAGAGGSH